MFKTLSLTTAALAMGAAALTPAPAAAQRYDGPRYERDYYDVQYRPAYRNDRRVYRGYDRRYQNRRFQNQRCDAGTGGTVIGAIAGGLLGNTVAGRGDRTLGTVLGAVGGGLAGRAIDRSDNPRRCR